MFELLVTMFELLLTLGIFVLWMIPAATVGLMGFGASIAYLEERGRTMRWVAIACSILFIVILVVPATRWPSIVLLIIPGIALATVEARDTYEFPESTRAALRVCVVEGRCPVEDGLLHLAMEKMELAFDRRFGAKGLVVGEWLFVFVFAITFPFTPLVEITTGKSIM